MPNPNSKKPQAACSLGRLKKNKQCHTQRGQREHECGQALPKVFAERIARINSHGDVGLHALAVALHGVRHALIQLPELCVGGLDPLLKGSAIDLNNLVALQNAGLVIGRGFFHHAARLLGGDAREMPHHHQPIRWDDRPQRHLPHPRAQHKADEQQTEAALQVIGLLGGRLSVCHADIVANISESMRLNECTRQRQVWVRPMTHITGAGVIDACAGS